MSELSSAQIDAIIKANYGDIFSVLGMQQSQDGKSLYLRAFIPGAERVCVMDKKNGKQVAELTKIDPAGFFDGKLGRRRKRFDYRLRVSQNGQTSERADPFGFGALINSDDLYLFCEGTHERVFDWMGAHPKKVNGVSGMHFVLWAPQASRVSVVGDFNRWDGRVHVMRKHPGAGIWEIFIPAVDSRCNYKYEIKSCDGELLPLKADPYAQIMQSAPNNASITPSLSKYRWQDTNWMSQRRCIEHQHSAVSIYEVHLGSWRRVTEADGTSRYLSYRELARELLPYVLELGFTHIQFMPLSEYPFDGSWGYQPLGLFAPTSRFGTPDDFKYLVDCAHQHGLGVLFDWVPGHFPCDSHGIGQLDGSCAYEHQDVRQGFHPQWKTLIYNYGRNEVHSYLLSNAHYWLSEYHLDGLRVDAVSSMLYLDYAKEGQDWVPNRFGGRENLDAVALLQKVNRRVQQKHPGTLMVAEESTAWPGVTAEVEHQGLGFGYKWNMGWMHDTLQYMQRDPIHRRFHHHEMTFGIDYAFSEQYVLPLSHDEVVHGKGSLLSKMPGDEWQRFANLRAYFGFMWTHPGKKLLFMGGEFAQINEWDHDRSLDWHLLQHAPHNGIWRLIKDLNYWYRELKALHELDHEPNGFEWLVADNAEQSILVYLRKGHSATKPVLVVVNMTPNCYYDYRIGVPLAGFYKECINTDSSHYGGSNVGNMGGVHARCQSFHGQPFELNLTIAPLATMVFECQGLL